MTHTIIYNSETHVIESKFQGEITCDEIKEFISEGALLAKEKNCNFLLADFREATLKLSTLEIYNVPPFIEDTYSSLGLNINLLKRAVVATREFQDYLFYETVVHNRGQRPKVFNDIDEARQWLSQSRNYSDQGFVSVATPSLE